MAGRRPSAISVNRALLSTGPGTGSGGGMMQKVAEFLGLDEKSRRKREQKRAIKQIVNSAFQGTGFAGKIWASLVSKFAVQVLGKCVINIWLNRSIYLQRF